MPFDWCESHARSIHLKRLMKWLSRDSLGAYVVSFHRAMIFMRGQALVVANFANVPMSNGEIATLKGGVRHLTVFQGGRVLREEKIGPVGQDGPHFLCRIKEVPVNGEALLGVCR